MVGQRLNTVSRQVKWLWWLVAAASLWLRSAVPIRAIGDAVLDDALFLRLAGQLGTGHWLGPYDQLTLAKGMFYPAFILASFAAGIPLHIAEQALYVAVSAGVAALAARGGGRWLALAIFATLAFNPVLLQPEMARVVREAIYVSLGLALVGLAARIALFDARAAWGRVVALGLASGVVFGAYWLTREEGVWLLPALAAVALVAAPSWFRSPARAGRALAALAAAALTGGAMIGAVAWTNAAQYGVFATSEFKTEAFQRGYGALARVRQDRWQRHVVLPRDARERAYAASPAAAELRPFLDGPLGETWRSVGCDRTAAAECPEILSGWFMWALRDAVAQAGHAGSGAAAAAFHTRLADEIDAACAQTPRWPAIRRGRRCCRRSAGTICPMPPAPAPRSACCWRAWATARWARRPASEPG